MTPADESRPPPRKSPFTGALTTSAGQVSFSRSGAGPTLVLLHDLAQSHASFEDLAGCLRARFHLIAMDLLGHGGSELGPPDLTVKAQADAVAEALGDLRTGKSILVGHSLGGSVAIQLAADHPELVSKIVLISSGCYDYRLPSSWRFFRQRLAWKLLGWAGGSGTVERALRLARANTGLARGAFDPLDSRAGWAALGRAFRQCTSEAALGSLEDLVETQLHTPALVIWGSENRLLPVAAARVLFRERHGVRFVEVTGAAHAVHEEQPAIVAELIRELAE